MAGNGRLYRNSPHWVGLVAMYQSNLGLTLEQAEAKAAEQYGWPYGHPNRVPEDEVLPVGYIITS